MSKKPQINREDHEKKRKLLASCHNCIIAGSQVARCMQLYANLWAKASAIDICIKVFHTANALNLLLRRVGKERAMRGDKENVEDMRK